MALVVVGSELEAALSSAQRLWSVEKKGFNFLFIYLFFFGMKMKMKNSLIGFWRGFPQDEAWGGFLGRQSRLVR